MNTDQLKAGADLAEKIEITKGILDHLDKTDEGVTPWCIFYRNDGISDKRTGPAFEIPAPCKVELVRHFTKVLASQEAEFAAL